MRTIAIFAALDLLVCLLAYQWVMSGAHRTLEPGSPVRVIFESEVK